MFKKYLECLVILGVLEKSNESEWGDPYFLHPKPNKYWLHFQIDLINLNNQSKSKPYPMPNINEMCFKWEGFKYSKSIVLNMGYYHTLLSENTSNLCTIIIPWVKYHDKNFPRVVINSPENLQQKMNDLFQES